MTPTDGILVAALTIVPLVSLIVAIIVARHNRDKDTKQEGIALGQMQADIGYIREGIDDLKKSDKIQSEELHTMSERLTKVETALEDHVKNRHIHVAANKGTKKK